MTDKELFLAVRDKLSLLQLPKYRQAAKIGVSESTYHRWSTRDSITLRSIERESLIKILAQ